MACTLAPLPPFPVLPPGITLGVSIPSPPFNLTFCCKILDFGPSTIIPLGFGLSIAAAAIIGTEIALLESYFDAIPIKCPREAS